MKPESVAQLCPLCESLEGRFFYQDNREYFRCAVCSLVFVLPAEFLSAEDEKAVYDCHQNSPDDELYRIFLNRIFEPMAKRLSPESYGLDFGSGPGPTLSVMFEDVGHRMEIYDPFYAPQAGVLQGKYNFITSSEVVEHLHHPRRELETLWTCLKLGGLLGLMTKRVIDQQAFASWHYKNDPTHVCFYSLETFQWLAEHWRAELIVAADDVVLFVKASS